MAAKSLTYVQCLRRLLIDTIRMPIKATATDVLVMQILASIYMVWMAFWSLIFPLSRTLFAYFCIVIFPVSFPLLAIVDMYNEKERYRSEVEFEKEWGEDISKESFYE
jgi:hypothetical protein